MEELDHLGRGRGGADVQRGQLVDPELLAQRRPDRSTPRPGLDRGLELLEDPRHAEEPRRPDLGEVADDLARVRAAGDREAELHREVVRAVALGDVGHRQVGDDVAAAREVQHRVVGVHREEHALVGELDALRVAGRARGVDQRQQVVGLDRLPGGVEVEVRVALELVEQVDLDHVLGAHAVAEARLDDADLRARVAQHELGLLGGGGVVDRERDGAEVHRGGVEQVELGPVGEHQRHRVAAAQAELVEPGGDPAHRSAYSPQVISISPPLVRSATSSPRAAAVAWKAAQTVCWLARHSTGDYPPLNRPAGWTAADSASSGVAPTTTRRAFSPPKVMTRWTGASAASPW